MGAIKYVGLESAGWYNTKSDERVNKYHLFYNKVSP